VDTVETTSLGPGLVAFLIVVALIIATGLLWYSMVRHLRKVPPTFADADPTSPVEAAAEANSDASPEAPTDADTETPTDAEVAEGSTPTAAPDLDGEDQPPATAG
jgi:hypothetical protein